MKKDFAGMEFKETEKQEKQDKNIRLEIEEGNTVIQPIAFALTEVTLEQLRAYRRKKIPSFILKRHGKIYFAQIPKDLNLRSANILGDHQCAMGEDICYRLSAASDEEGGCAKVRDCYPDRCIENYPWIGVGYQISNSVPGHNVFVVTQCDHFLEFPKRKTSVEEFNKRIVVLAQNLWPDVETRGDVIKRIKSNEQKSNENKQKN